jgi:hypothetical protein
MRKSEQETTLKFASLISDPFCTIHLSTLAPRRNLSPVNNFLLPLSEDARIKTIDANGWENLRDVISLSKRQLPLRLPKEQDPNIHSVGERNHCRD